MTPDRIVEFAEDFARVASAGGGAKALATHLSEAVGVGVLVEDAEWRHLATAGRGSLPATARGLRNGSAHTVPIAAGSNQLGYLSVFPGPAGVDEDLTRIVRLAASAIALELARETDGGRSRRRTFWERLLGGTYHEFGPAREDAHGRGIALAAHYVCIALEAEAGADEDHPSALADLRALCADTFRSSEADVGIIERGVTVVVLMPAAREVDAENAKTAAFLLPRSGRKAQTRIASCGRSVARAPMRSTCNVVCGPQKQHSQSRDVSTAVVASRLLTISAHTSSFTWRNCRRAFGTRARRSRPVARLRSKNTRPSSNVRLSLYFSTGQNVKTTASELNVHRHTVFYRLRQINEILGRSLDSTHDQLTLRLAIAIDALHNQH